MNRKEAERLTRQADTLRALGFTQDEAESLRRISMTLHRWHELECGTDGGCIEREERWAIERAGWPKADRVRWWDGAKWVRQSERRTYTNEEQEAYTLTCGNVPIDMAWRDTGSKPYWLNSESMRRTPIADREKGALKRLAGIIKARNLREQPIQHTAGTCPGKPCGACCDHVERPDGFTVRPYVQTDPRGAALYILRPGDVPAGEDPAAYYSRGICVY